MPIRFINKNTFVVQVQRDGVRKTRRGTGTEADAKRIERELAGEMEHEKKLDEAARLLGVSQVVALPSGKAPRAKRIPTLNEFIKDRWTEHAAVVQNLTTRRAQRTAIAYLAYYLGDKPLDVLLRRVEINAFIESMKKNGPISFARRNDGQPVARKVDELKHATINKTLACLRAILNLAHGEEVIAEAPRIDLLPEDDSHAVIPPEEEEIEQLVRVCEDFRAVAPWLPEVIEFLAETGLRRSECFNLRWRSVDLPRSAIRVEMTQKGRVVNGKAWKPKHGKFREVPLSKKAKAVIEKVRAAGPVAPDDFVFPNKGGCPYERLEGAGEGAGKGYFGDAVEAAGLRGKVTMHSLRHRFAVTLLTRGVPITVVSELLGHSHINLTVKRYGRFASDAKVKWEAVRVLDAPEAPPPEPKSEAAPVAMQRLCSPTVANPAAPTPDPSAPARRFVALDGGRKARRTAG